MLIFLALFLFELYCAGFLIFLLILLVRKNKVPWPVVLLNIACLALLYWTKLKVERHELIFVGGYQAPSDDWGRGLANMMNSFQNLAIVYLVVLVSQLVFFRLFSIESERVNRSNKNV